MCSPSSFYVVVWRWMLVSFCVLVGVWRFGAELVGLGFFGRLLFVLFSDSRWVGSLLSWCILPFGSVQTRISPFCRFRTMLLLLFVSCFSVLSFCVAVWCSFYVFCVSGTRLSGGIGCGFFAVVWLLKPEKVVWFLWNRLNWCPCAWFSDIQGLLRSAGLKTKGFLFSGTYYPSPCYDWDWTVMLERAIMPAVLFRGLLVRGSWYRVGGRSIRQLWT